jgi:RimJ/RimL family protein N-acetyltransferase
MMNEALALRWKVETERLWLLPLTGEDLDRLAEGRGHLEKALGLAPSGLETSETIQKEMRDALRHWRAFVREHPKDYRWGTNWEIIRREESRSIGGIGMSGLPDEEGKVTIGYVIDDRYQGKGYASEALKGLVGWAFRHEKLRALEALTPKTNRISQRVLEKNGFQPLKEIEFQGIEIIAWFLFREAVPNPGFSN